MNFSRKLILVAGAALLAACGDKVTVAGPTTTPPPVAKINSVEVAPATATLTVGQSITMTAAVNADVGLATTVTWSSSDASKASVSSAGVVLAVAATPGVAICAASTVDTGKKGCASVVVQAAPTVLPASISINSITTTGNLSATVDPSNVVGNIDVTLNVSPGNQTISKIVLTLGGVRIDSQTFSAAQSAALRYAADEAIAAQTTFPQVVFSINTAAFSATTGIAKFANGTKALSAQLYTTQGGAASAASASAQSNLTFNNADKLAATIAPVGSYTLATSVLGYQWSKIPDSLDVTILPVTYSARAITSIAMRPICGDSVWTKVLAPFKVRYGVPATGYQTTNSVLGCSATAEVDGEAPVYVSAIMADGNAAPALAFDAAAIAAQRRRFDNMGPSVPTITQTVGISGIKTRRAAGWLNDAVKLTSVIGSTEGTSSTAIAFSGSIISTRGTEASGVSAGAATTDAQIVTYKAFIGADLATALASTAVTTTTGIAENASQGLCLVVRGYDYLGNASAAPTTCLYNATTNPSASGVGIDRTAPSYAYYPSANMIGYTGAGTATNALTGYRRMPTDSLIDMGGAVYAAKFVVFAADTAVGTSLGRSGMLGVRYSVTRQNGGFTTVVYGAPATVAPSFGTDGFVTTTANADFNDDLAPRSDDFATAGLGGLQGYYTVSATAYDAAGNSLAVAARNGYVDVTAPLTVGVSTLTQAQVGASGNFNVDNQDGLDLGYSLLAQQYFDGAALTINWRCSRTDIKTTFGPSFVIGDTRAITGCAIPAGTMAKLNTTGELLDPTVANGTLATTGGGLFSLSSDFSANVLALATVAAGNNIGTQPTAAAILGGLGGTNATADACGAIAFHYALAGFCKVVLAATPTTYYTGAGVLVATTGELKATVTVVDSMLIPTVATGTLTLAETKTAGLVTAKTRANSPFAAVTFLVNDGQTDIPFAAGSAVIASEAVDSTTSPLYYRITNTTTYSAVFTPGASFGIYSPIARGATNITTAGVAFAVRAVARYKYPPTTAVATTNTGVVALGAVAAAVSSGSTSTSDINVVTTQVLTVTIKK